MAYYEKVLARHLKYSSAELSALQFSDIAAESPRDQYFVLLGHIITVGIKNLSERQVCKYMQWMLDDPGVYDCGFIAWFYYNSCLNDSLKYPAHAVVCQMLPEGLGRLTLRFLFNSACVGDPTQINTLRVIHECTGTKWYLALITYFYLCSGIDEQCLNYFFSDVHHITGEDAVTCMYLSTLFIWSADVLRELIRRNYTIRSVYRVLRKIGTIGIHEQYVSPKMSYFKKRLVSPVRYSEFKYIKGLPDLPDYYTPVRCLWNSDFIDDSSLYTVVHPNDLYVTWFASLTDKQIEHLKELDMDVYRNCSAGNFAEIALVLNHIMYNFS